MGIRTTVVVLAAISSTLAACGGNPNSDLGAGGAASTSTTTSVTTTSVTTTTSAATGSLANSIVDLLGEQRSWYPAPGALAVVRVGDETWSGWSGGAALDDTPITDTTTFRIASITKPIVATLLLDAIQRGLLTLDDTVDDIVPGIIRPDPPVTVRMLLDHTSGVFDEGNEGDPIADAALLADPALQAEVADLTERYAAGQQVVASDRLLIALAETHDRYFAPRDGYHYSNINYQIAALVVEEVTGLSLSELLQTRIVEPLGLQHTSIAPPDMSSPDFRGYDTSTRDGSLVDVTDDLLAFGNGGNGGIISTADELLTILQAVLSGELLDDDLVVAMKTATAQSQGTYGLGLGPYRFTCGTFYGHGGSVNGTVSIAVVSEDGSAGTVAALNLRNGDDPRLAALADRLVCGIGGF